MPSVSHRVGFIHGFFITCPSPTNQYFRSVHHSGFICGFFNVQAPYAARLQQVPTYPASFPETERPHCDPGFSLKAIVYSPLSFLR